jgi:hypothetical protein
MADAVNVNHAFASTKTDSADASIVSKNEWNAPEIFSGGLDGQPILKDSSKATGAKWGQAITVDIIGATYTGASPSTALFTKTVTVTDKCAVVGFIQFSATLSSGTSFTVTPRRNGTNLTPFVMTANGTVQSVQFASAEIAAGSAVFDVILTTSGGATISAFSGTITYLTLPTP